MVGNLKPQDIKEDDREYKTQYYTGKILYQENYWGTSLFHNDQQNIDQYTVNWFL